MRISKRRILRRESRKWNFWRLVRILFLLFPAAFLTTSLPCSIEVSGVPLSQHIRKLREGKWRAAMIQYAALASYQYISQFSSNRCRYTGASKSERVEGSRAPSLRRCLSYQQEVHQLWNNSIPHDTLLNLCENFTNEWFRTKEEMCRYTECCIGWTWEERLKNITFRVEYFDQHCFHRCSIVETYHPTN